jgi:ABC-2 type transport system ATP-binding protein
MTDAIVLRNLTKTFGETVAVRDLELVVPQGALYGVIGPNGAGKTTTIRMILSILFPDRGELTVLGNRSALEVKDRIGYLPEERGLYKKMRVGEFLAYLALRVPHILMHNNKIDWSITKQYSSQCNILEAPEPA